MSRALAALVVALSLVASASSAPGGPITGVCSPTAKERPVVQRELAAFVKYNSVPGAVELVCTPEGTTQVASGFSDLAAKTELRPTDRFWIGSVTKTFVATVVLQLVAEGKLDLGDTVERRLPGVVPRGREITIRELLSHTSGIPNYFEDTRVQHWLAKNPRALIRPRTLIARAVSHPLAFKPGTYWAYSNTNYLLLGLIIEKATGHNVRAELERRIFAPLELSHTAYDSPRHGLAVGEVHGYDLTGTHPRDVSLQTLGGPWSDGAIVSNAGDVARFYSALLGGKLLPEPQLRAMKTLTLSHRGYGLGIAHASRFVLCREAWGHSGATPGYLTFVYASGDGRRVVVAATNGVSPPAGGGLDMTATDAYCGR